MNYDTLYQPGRHYIWPFHEFVPFTKTVQFLNLNLEVYTKDDGSGNQGGVAGTPLDLQIGIQYLLIQSQVIPLFQKYNLVRWLLWAKTPTLMKLKCGIQGYGSVLKNLAIETIKNNATLFSADEYLTARRTIEARFLQVVTAELRDVGLVELEALQLKQVIFPASFYRRKLDAGIQEQRNLIEEFNQNSTVIREKTRNEVVFIGNDATQKLKAFEAQGSLIVQQGKNNATRIRGAADVQGLEFLSTALGISNQTQLLSLGYLVNLKEHSSVKAFINFHELGDMKQLTP